MPIAPCHPGDASFSFRFGAGLPWMILASLAIGWGNDGIAQANGDAGGAIGKDQPAEVAPVISDTPMVRELLRRARLDAASVPSVLESLTRAKEWVAVDQLLTGLGKPGATDDSRLADVAAQLGPALLIRLQAREELSAEALGVLRRASLAAKTSAVDPTSLNSAIDELRSANGSKDPEMVDRRLAASRVLLRGGDAAVEAIIRTLLKNPEKRSLDEGAQGDLMSILERSRASSRGLLLQVATYGTTNQRAVALAWMLRLKDPFAFPVSLCSLHTVAAGDAERSVAANALLGVWDNGPSALPSREQAIAGLVSLLHRERRRAEIQQSGEESTLVWVLDPAAVAVNGQGAELGTLSRLEVDKKSALIRGSVDIGALIRRIGSLPESVEYEVVGDELAYLMLVDPEWGDESQVRAVVSRFPWLVEPSRMGRFLQASRDSENDAALLACLRLIGAGAVNDAVKLLTGDEPAVSTLVELSSSSIPKIRYESLLAIDEIEGLVGRQSYAGRSSVERTRRELQNLGQLPKVLLIETRPLVVSAMSNLLTQMGYEVSTVETAAEALRQVAKGGDLRFLLAKTQLWDVTPVELVDRVRRTTLGRRLPVVFFTDETTRADLDADQIRRPRWSAVTEVIQRPYSAAGLIPIMERIDESAPVPQLTPDERAWYRNLGSREPGFRN
ncbi:MAG: hypothetical protein AAF989_02820 [Planctomycetota bacterium]